MMSIRIIMISMLVWLSAVVSYATTRTYVETDSHRAYARLSELQVGELQSPTVPTDTAEAGVGTDTKGAQAPTMLPTPVSVRMNETRSHQIHSREESVVFFEPGKASLSPGMIKQLDAMIRILRSESRINGVRIIGFADHSGGAHYNEALSRRRAENVKRYLVANGLADTWVVDTRWLGAQPPAVSCPVNKMNPTLNECQQNDRRVEVEVDYTPDMRASR